MLSTLMSITRSLIIIMSYVKSDSGDPDDMGLFKKQKPTEPEIIPLEDFNKRADGDDPPVVTSAGSETSSYTDDSDDATNDTIDDADAEPVHVRQLDSETDIVIDGLSSSVSPALPALSVSPVFPNRSCNQSADDDIANSIVEQIKNAGKREVSDDEEAKTDRESRSGSRSQSSERTPRISNRWGKEIVPTDTSTAAQNPPAIEWDEWLRSTKSILGSVARVSATAASTAVMATADRVPDHVKESVKATSQVVAARAVDTVTTFASGTREVFNKSVRPILYDTFGQFHARDITAEIIKTIPNDSTVLVVGIRTCCGWAMNAELIKSRQIKIVGLDTNESFVLRGRHALIDYGLEDHITLLHIPSKMDNAIDNLDTALAYVGAEKQYDYVVISEWYSITPNVNNLLRRCEKYMNALGYMIVVSLLFDEYDIRLDTIKQNLIYVTGVDYGQMMIKYDLVSYITQERNADDFEFKQIGETTFGTLELNTYMARWRPN